MFKTIQVFNPYKPSVLFVGHRQKMQKQIRRRKMIICVDIFTRFDGQVK